MISKGLREAAKTQGDNLHVIPRVHGWAVKKEGAKVAYRVYRSKERAVKEAKNLAQKGKGSIIIIHDADGRLSRINQVSR